MYFFFFTLLERTANAVRRIVNVKHLAYICKYERKHFLAFAQNFSHYITNNLRRYSVSFGFFARSPSLAPCTSVRKKPQLIVVTFS